ncbi:MAG: laminin B domain-containing protein [Bacteroidota bacterium]
MIQHFILKASLCLACLGLFSLNGFSQVLDDFEGGSLNGWFSEGDGQESLSSAQGNPGFSLRVADNATGDINYAIAPTPYLGDWFTGLSANDTISVDIYVQSNDPDTLVNPFPVFQLVGPGGTANALDGLNLPRNTWNQVKVALNPSDWTMQSGDWNALLENVTLFRIRAEYITGNENVYLDNVQLTLSPVRGALEDTVCSTFEDGTFDGWNFAENGGLDIDSIHGNPGLGLGIGDAGSAITQAIAPPKFLGDWSPLLDSGYMSFDLKIDNSSSGPLYGKDYLVRISGNDAIAEIRPSDSVLNLAIDQWHTYTFLIDSTVWNVTAGSWDSLILSVDEIRLELEFITGSERASFDNFCLIPKAKNTTQVRGAQPISSIRLFPNPASGQFTLESPQAAIGSVSLYDLSGRAIAAQIDQDRHEARVRSEYRGLAIVKVQTEQGVWVQKVQFD